MAQAATTRGRLTALGVLVAMPLVGLALLLSVPAYDVMWEHHPSHFWLVLTVAVVNVVLAVLTSEAAGQRNDVRLFLVSLAMLASAGFLALHALATPKVLLATPNEGFVIATPVGLVVAAVFAAASALPHEEGETRLGPRTQRWLRSALLIAIAAWAIASFAQVEPLSRTPGEEAPRSSGCCRRSRSCSTASPRSGTSSCMTGVAGPCRSRSRWRSCSWPRRWWRSRSAEAGTRRGGSGTC